MFANLGPTLTLLLFPNQHLSVIRAGSQYVSEFWVCPSDLPDWTCVSVERFDSNNQGKKVVKISSKENKMQHQFSNIASRIPERVPLQSLPASSLLCITFYDIENLDCSIGRTGGKPFSIVV